MNTIINTGICSFGMSGKLFHAPFIDAHPGFAFKAITERTKNEAAAKYPQVKTYRTIDELIADKDLDLIVVNTPIQTHLEFTRQALEAGKHVVLEKPMVITAEEGRELDALAQKKGLILSIYQNRRYDSDYRIVKEVVERKWLGDIREVQFAYDRFRPQPGGKIHKEGALPGSGTLYDLGPHLIDQALQLFGQPEALFADIAMMRDEALSDDYFEIIFFYPKMRVRLKSAILVREALPAYSLHGNKGSFIKTRSDVQEKLLLENVVPSLGNWAPSPSNEDGILHTEINGEVVRKTLPTPIGNYMEYYDELYKALTGQGPNPVPAAESIRNIEIIEFARKSAAEGKKIFL